jgi:hypothetical protein
MKEKLKGLRIESLEEVEEWDLGWNWKESGRRRCQHNFNNIHYATTSVLGNYQLPVVESTTRLCFGSASTVIFEDFPSDNIFGIKSKILLTIHWVFLVMTRLLVVCVWQFGLRRCFRATSEFGKVVREETLRKIRCKPCLHGGFHSMLC